MCQGLSHFSGVLHHFVLAKLATTSIRVKCILSSTMYSKHNSRISVSMIGLSVYYQVVSINSPTSQNSRRVSIMVMDWYVDLETCRLLRRNVQRNVQMQV